MGAWASRGLIKPRVSRGRWAPASRPPGPRRLRPPGARASGTPRQLGPHRRPAAAPRGGIRAAPAPSPSGSAPASGARGRALRPGRPLRRVRLEGGDATHPTRGDERRRSRPVSGSQGRRGGGGGAGTRGAGRFPAQPRPAAPRLRRPSSGRRSGAGPEGARSESPPSIPGLHRGSGTGPERSFPRTRSSLRLPPAPRPARSPSKFASFRCPFSPRL